MQLTDQNKFINSLGDTTTPHTSPWWVGEGDYRVAFDYLLLDGDCVALHAIYGNASRKTHSEFFYDIAHFEDAEKCAHNLVASAKALILAHDNDSLSEADHDRGLDFIETMRGEMIYS